MIVKYRDFRFVIPFVVQVGLYVSPVGFSAKVVPPEWLLLYSVNPMVGVIDGFRWAILGGDSPLYLPGFAVSMLVTAGMLLARHPHVSPHRARLRRPDLSMSDVVIRAEKLGKKFIIGHKVEYSAILGEALVRRRAELVRARRRHAARPRRRRRRRSRGILGAARRRVRDQARRGRQHHRPQRRRQDDPARRSCRASSSRRWAGSS